MSTDLQLLSVNGIDIYTSDVEMLPEEYMSTLPDENMIYNKSAIFNGLLDLIYKRLLKNIIVRDSGITNTAYNYSVLNDIFNNIYNIFFFVDLLHYSAHLKKQYLFHFHYFVDY